MRLRRISAETCHLSRLANAGRGVSLLAAIPAIILTARVAAHRFALFSILGNGHDEGNEGGDD
jgi:hypothetical protein